MAQSLSVREAAGALGISPGRVRAMEAAGELRSIAPSGRPLRFSPDDVRGLGRADAARPRRRALLSPAAIEATVEAVLEKVVARLPGAVEVGLEPLRAELAAARASVEEQGRLRMQAEARAVAAERELEVLRMQLAEASAQRSGRFRRRRRQPSVIVVAQPQG